MRKKRQVAASAKAVSALVPRSATALQKDTAAGRERRVGVALFLITNGRVRRGDLSRRAAPAFSGLSAAKAAAPRQATAATSAGNGGGVARDVSAAFLPPGEKNRTFLQKSY
jgi:hypothetical protein